MTCKNPKPDLAKMNAYIKFGEILPLVLKILSGNKFLAFSQDIERKRYFGVNKGP